MFPFYERPLPITAKDIEILRNLVTSADSFWSWRGPKLCGGFHPDYALAWSDGANTCYLLLCFGCGEMFFLDSKHALVAEVREEARKQFAAILSKYHDQRPISQ